MKILIVEDENLVASALANQLNELDYFDICFAQKYSEIDEILKSTELNLIFMDIGLKESNLDGIQIAEKIFESYLIPIIFLSAYSDDFTLSRIKKVPFANYLVKPSSTRQLYVSINNAIEFNKTISNSFDASGMECPLLHRDNYFYLKSGNAYVKISTDQILWIKSVRGGIEFHLINEKTKMLTASITSFLRQFQHQSLIRVHRSYVINKTKVVAIQDKNLIISDGNFNKTVPVGQSYKQIFESNFRTLKSD